MIKTCFNCEHYHGCLVAVDDKYGYHIHDYCDKLNMVLQNTNEIEVNKFLIEHWADMEEALKDTPLTNGVFDDLETGEAGCWMFEEADNKISDVRLLDNRHHNRALAIKTLEYMFAVDKVYDTSNSNDWYKLDDYYDEEELEHLKNFLNRLKGEEDDYSNQTRKRNI
jgi:hypothetical protein